MFICWPNWLWEGRGRGCGHVTCFYSSASLLFSEHPLCHDLCWLPFGTKQYFTKCPLNILILLYHVTY